MMAGSPPPPRSTLSPQRLLKARLPLHAGQSPHVMTRPVKGWLVLWGWSGGAGDTWAIGLSPGRAGWPGRAGSQVSWAQGVTLS